MSSCNAAAGRPTACWASRTATLPRSGRAAPRLPLVLLPPEGSLLPLAQPPLAALLEPMKRSGPAPQPLLFGGVPAAPLTPPSLHVGSGKSRARIWGRLWQAPPLPDGAGTAHVRGDGEPRRGGPAAPGALPSHPRGRPDGKTRTRPQELPKPGPGQQLGHVPARKSVRRLSVVSACTSAAGPGADVSSQGLSRASPCPIARPRRPVLLLTAPSAPTSRGSALPPACAARCSLSTATPKSLLLRGLTAWCCSLPRKEKHVGGRPNVKTQSGSL